MNLTGCGGLSEDDQAICAAAEGRDDDLVWSLAETADNDAIREDASRLKVGISEEIADAAMESIQEHC